MRLSEWKSGQPGLTTEALAELCGIRRVAMQRLLSGRTMPKPATMARISEVTGGAVAATDMYDAYNACYAARATGKTILAGNTDSAPCG